MMKYRYASCESHFLGDVCEQKLSFSTWNDSGKVIAVIFDAMAL